MEDMFVVPRTREGFYHYTGGVEVKRFFVLQFLCLMCNSLGRNQPYYGFCSLRGPSLAGNEITES